LFRGCRGRQPPPHRAFRRAKKVCFRFAPALAIGVCRSRGGQFFGLAVAADSIDFLLIPVRTQSASAVAGAIRKGISSPKNKGFCDSPHPAMWNRLPRRPSAVPEETFGMIAIELASRRWCARR
jgi:hypothetical protein